MISFRVDDMTCGHCVGSITKSIKAIDAGATVQIDLATHRVDIEPSATGALELGDAIKEAGYTPVAIAATVGAAATAAAPARKGCRCG